MQLTLQEPMQINSLIHFPLKSYRVHEVCGSATFGFASICAAQMPGRVLWIREDWCSDTVNPPGVAAYFEPSRMLMAQAATQTDALAVAEEALRDGALPLVVIELSQSLDLTAGRRLQLAAQAGKATGLCIVPEGMGSNAAQTRWRCNTVFDPTGADSTLMHWHLIKNKSGTLCDWYVRWDPTKSNPADRLAVVPPPRQ
jgi:protein ImuA